MPGQAADFLHEFEAVGRQLLHDLTLGHLVQWSDRHGFVFSPVFVLSKCSSVKSLRS